MLTLMSRISRRFGSVRKFALSLVTVDRTPRPNYLAQTLRNFERGGIFKSSLFHSLSIADSGVGTHWPSPALIESGISLTHVGVCRTGARRPSSVNAATALAAGVATGCEWILFFEDDVDVCGDFLESVDRWLTAYAKPEYHVFPFGANYPHVQVAADNLEFVWEYDTHLFYGSQCFAIRADDARSLADYWSTNPEVPGGTDMAIDIMVAQWHRLKFPTQPNFLASAPSFIQHIGRASYATTKEVTHTFASWPGPFWVFEPGVVRA